MEKTEGEKIQLFTPTLHFFIHMSKEKAREKGSAAKHTGRLKVSLIEMPKAHEVKLINIHSFRHSTALLAKWL